MVLQLKFWHFYTKYVLISQKILVEKLNKNSSLSQVDFGNMLELSIFVKINCNEEQGHTKTK